MLYFCPDSFDVQHFPDTPPQLGPVPSRRATQAAWDQLILTLDPATKADLESALDVLRRRLLLSDD
jgi:hypothetical protein